MNLARVLWPTAVVFGKDDRLAFTGRVVYEGSQTPAPRDVGILVEVFDGEKLWSDGSLTSDGGYAVEVPLSSALTLQSSPSRTCLISITNIPGRGEDMTGTLGVDHAPSCG